MRFGVRAKSVGTAAEVATGLITTRRVIFTPNAEIKDELKDTSIQITCYDRNGNVVKQVTSDDSGNVEDTDTDSSASDSTDTSGGSSDTGGSTDSGQTSGGSTTPSGDSGTGED